MSSSQRTMYEFLSQKIKEPIIEWRTCTWTGKDFPIFQGDKELLQRISPKIGNKTYELNLPTLSRQARRRRRLMRRNDRKLYKSICSITGKNIVSIYHPEQNFSIVENQERFRSIDNSVHGQDIDFKKTFHEQFSTLIQKTSKQNTLTVGFIENSTYTNNVGDMKNCYMSFDAGIAEETMYTVRCSNSKKVIDSLEVNRGEVIYDSIAITNSQYIFYSNTVQDSSYGAFLYSCFSCHHCICCSNLVNKSYHIFNKPVSKEEFEKAWTSLFNGTRKHYKHFQEQYSKLLTQTPRRALTITNASDSRGHNITNSNKIVMCDEMQGSENIRYSDRIISYSKCYDCMDISSRGGSMHHCYELNCCGSDEKTTASNCHFGSYLFWGVNNTQYSIHMPSISDYCFGCANVNQTQYMIFNKKYSKEDYCTQVDTLITHMQNSGERGEFLDPAYSPFPYNDTIANDYYPIANLSYPDGRIVKINPHGTGTMHILKPDQTLSPAELDLGGKERIRTSWRTKEQEVDIPTDLIITPAEQNPDSIHNIDESIFKKALICPISKRPFRITKPELQFYRQHGIPLPIHHPDIRHQHRLEQTIFFDLHLRTCDLTGETILSVYPTDYPAQVYSIEAFDQKFFG